MIDLRHINCPCTKCEDRQAACHTSCQKYKRYKFLCNIEINKIREERKVDNAIREITYKGYESRKTNKSEPLKHGRKK